MDFLLDLFDIFDMANSNFFLATNNLGDLGHARRPRRHACKRSSKVTSDVEVDGVEVDLDVVLDVDVDKDDVDEEAFSRACSNRK